MRVPISIKVRIAKAISHPTVGRLLARIFGDRIPSRGYIVDTSSALVIPQVKADLFWRLYESAEIRFVERYLRRDLDVIELGSSLGVVTCHIRRRIDNSRRLVCVEADPDLVPVIGRNLSINALHGKVSIVNKAIDYHSSGRESVRFVGGASHLEGSIGSEAVQNGKARVNTTTLSHIINEHAIGDYALVSDIEGAEVGIALRETEALRRCKQIIIELHPTRFDDKETDIERVREAFVNLHGFTLRDSYGPVCVFEKQPDSC